MHAFTLCMCALLFVFGSDRLPVPEHLLSDRAVFFVWCAAALPDCNVYWLYPSPAFPAADYGGSALLHTAHHAIIITDHGCRHPPLLTDSQAVIVCCTLQVSYGLLGVGVYR